MIITKAYKLSLILPLVIPLLLSPLFFIKINLPEWLGTIIFFTIYSGIIGGVPYLLLILFLLWWMRYKDESSIRRILLLSPIIMIPIFLIFVEVISLLRFGIKKSVSEFSEVFLFYTPFVLIFGYAYVVFVISSFDKASTRSSHSVT